MADDGRREFEDRARALYRQAVADLTPAETARLARGRDHVLGTRRRSAAGWWAATAAVATLSAVAVAFLLEVGREPGPGPMVETDLDAEAVELLMAEENLDMIAELDFYLWLDAEPDTG
jgi:hypothetical protein